MIKLLEFDKSAKKSHIPIVARSLYSFPYGNIFKFISLNWLKSTKFKGHIPLLVVATLVFPIAHYHNVLQLLTNICTYIFRRKKYYWKGWCVKDETIE